MQKYLSWILLVLALLFGALGGIIAAKSNSTFFWIGFLAGLGCLGGFLYINDKDDKALLKEEPTVSKTPEAKAPEAETATEAASS